MSVRTVSFEELADLMRRAGDRLPAVARVVMTAATQAMLRDVVRNRMSPGPGSYLGVVTGGGRRSMNASVTTAPDAVRGAIGTTLRYIMAHEQGFVGPVGVRAHTRRNFSLKTRAGKVTKKSSREFKKRSAAGQQAVSYVRAHTRQVNIRARRFMRDTVLQEAGQLSALIQTGAAPIELRVVRALQILVGEGRMPKTSELGLAEN